MAGDHHRTPDYRRRALAVRRAANANPLTQCWRCGELARPGDPWQAGHTIDGDNRAPLAPEHRLCNATAGAVMRNRKRRGQPTTNPQSRIW
jgi:hypothetical protein